MTEGERKALAKELLPDLTDEVSKKMEGKWHRHPALLLVIGFLLTYGVGAALSAGWEADERERVAAADHIARLRESRWAFHDSLVNRIGGFKTAMNRMALAYGDEYEDSKEGLEQRADACAAYRLASRGWIQQQHVFFHKGKLLFPPPSRVPRIIAAIDSMLYNHPRCPNMIFPELKRLRPRNMLKIDTVFLVNGYCRALVEVDHGLDSLIGRLSYEAEETYWASFAK